MNIKKAAEKCINTDEAMAKTSGMRFLRIIAVIIPEIRSRQAINVDIRKRIAGISSGYTKGKHPI